MSEKLSEQVLYGELGQRLAGGQREARDKLVAGIATLEARLKKAVRCVMEASRIQNEANLKADFYTYDLMRTVLRDGYGENWELEVASIAAQEEQRE